MKPLISLGIALAIVMTMNVLPKMYQPPAVGLIVFAAACLGWPYAQQTTGNDKLRWLRRNGRIHPFAYFMFFAGMSILAMSVMGVALCDNPLCK